MNIVNPHRFGGEIISYLLDDYPNALAAFSLRKLKTGATYAIKIRRDNDNATTDVELETIGSISLLSIVSAGGTLGNWIGANNGFVNTWFDQSGNGWDASNPITTLQPQIIDNGVIILENNIPVIRGVNKHLYTSDTSALNTEMSVFIVGKILEGDNSQAFWGSYNSTNFAPSLIINTGYFDAVFTQYTTLKILLINELQNLFTMFGSDVINEVYLNGGGRVANNKGLSSFKDISLLGRGDSYSLSGGNLSEIIFYTQYQDANKLQIESNINNFYSIY